MKSEFELPRAALLDAAVELLGRSARGGAVRVRGESMRPMLHPGQRLAVEFSPDRLDRGDLLLFRQGDCLLLHRLIGRARPHEGQPRLRTRGDGARVLDPPLAPELVVGRVVALEDGSRWRSTRGPAARRYARCVAWHDLSWSGLAVPASVVDGLLSRLGLPALFRPAVTALDHWVLGRVHGLAFRGSHPVVSRPESVDP